MPSRTSVDSPTWSQKIRFLWKLSPEQRVPWLKSVCKPQGLPRRKDSGLLCVQSYGYTSWNFSNQHPSCPNPRLVSTPPPATAPSDLRPPSESAHCSFSPCLSLLPSTPEQLVKCISQSPSRLLNVCPLPIGESSSFFAWHSRPSGSSPSPSLNLIHQHLPSHCGLPPTEPLQVAKVLWSLSLFLSSWLLLLLFPLPETPHSGAVRI